MNKQQVKEMVQERMEQGYDVIISIPVSAGFLGDMEAICFYDAVKERMMEATNPLRTTSRATVGDGLKAFVYGETYKMKADRGYLERFVEMSSQFGEVADILGRNY